MIKKYNEKKNIVGTVIRTAREEKGISKSALSRQLELLGVYINRDELYLMEHNNLMIKDFELIAISKILDIDLNTFKKCLYD